jgi:hypothetical protein
LHIAISNAVALKSWHDFKFLHGDFSGNGFVWSLIGVLLVFAVISALTIQAALVLDAPHRPQSCAKWPVDVSEATVPVPPSQADLENSVASI